MKKKERMVVYNYKFLNLENCSDGKAHRGSSNKLLITELLLLGYIIINE